jgi:colanic acid/amylovoran biosynthesis glycosyltransferase
MRLAYIVSRFPHPSETFIVRELDALDAQGDVSIELFSLFEPVDESVHSAASRWAARLFRPRLSSALRAVCWWLLRRPLRLATTMALVVGGHLASPRVLVRALVTVPLAAALARRLHAVSVQHMHAHYATYPALSAWICHRLLGTPYSFTAHAHDIFIDQSMLRRKLADATFTVAVSEYNRRFLSTYGDPARVHVVHCGIDPRAYPYRPRDVPLEGPVRVLCVASLQEYKGHAVLLKALADAPALARLELELLGGGPLRGELERRVAELGLTDRVSFHGSASEETVRRRLGQADLFVLPSIIARDGQMEGLPVVLIEALASGLSVVTTNISGIPELVTDGHTGLLTPPGDALALREALEEMSDARFCPDHAAGRELVEREFDVRVSALRLRGLFEGVSRPGGLRWPPACAPRRSPT